MASDPGNCVCGTGLPFEACCGPLLAGDQPASSALALMRSRYTAYVRGEIDYIMRTQESGEGIDRESTESWSRNSEWLGLEVVKSEGGIEGHQEGSVEFIARYRHQGEEHAHHEVAEFRRDGPGWILIDGKMVNSTFVRTQPKVGPNQPCPCGSGKKFKKCCGKP